MQYNTIIEILESDVINNTSYHFTGSEADWDNWWTYDGISGTFQHPFSLKHQTELRIK